MVVVSELTAILVTLYIKLNVVWYFRSWNTFGSSSRRLQAGWKDHFWSWTSPWLRPTLSYRNFRRHSGKEMATRLRTGILLWRIYYDAFIVTHLLWRIYCWIIAYPTKVEEYLTYYNKAIQTSWRIIMWRIFVTHFWDAFIVTHLLWRIYYWIIAYVPYKSWGVFDLLYYFKAIQTNWRIIIWRIFVTHSLWRIYCDAFFVE